MIKSIDVYVVRRGSNNDLRDSKPCIDCYNCMKKYNMRNLIYSTDDGELIKVRFNNFKPTKESLGRKFIDGGMKPIIRDKKVRNIKKYRYYHSGYNLSKKHMKYIKFDSVSDYIKQQECLSKFMESCSNSKANTVISEPIDNTIYSDSDPGYCL